MIVLHELLHSLTKDEKRLYSQHRRNGRFSRIYEAYLASETYSKLIDKELYEKAFSDVSKPFYSMQKRSLFDDVVTVLLSYSNLQLPQYRLPRSLAKAQVLLERDAPAAATYYLEEAKQQTTDDTDPVWMLSLVHAQKAAEAKLGEADYYRYMALLREEKELVKRLTEQSDLPSVRSAFQMLIRNRDDFTQDELEHNAHELMRLVGTIPDSEIALFDKLEVDMAFHQLTDQMDKYHRELVQLYQRIEKQHPRQPPASYFRVLNLALRSGLEVGDFLLLSGLLYKTEKLLDEFPNIFPPEYLTDYLEVAALYHFYENELPQALREMEELLAMPNVPTEQAERCAFYYLAMLVAAHLPQQAQHSLSQLAKRYPSMNASPVADVVQTVLAVDMHENPDEVLLQIERVKKGLRKNPAFKPLLECVGAIQTYLERKNLKAKSLKVFPQDWEPILRVDFWLQAKLENKFYYNLIAELWQARKRVFV